MTLEDRELHAHTLWSVEHSNHALDVFLALLRRCAIDVAADVRSQPRSVYAAWFDREALARSLAAVGIRYVYLGRELGGRPIDARHYDAKGHVRYDLVADAR